MSDLQILTQDKSTAFKVLSWGFVFVLAVFLPHEIPADYHNYKLSQSKTWFMAYSVPPSLIVLTGIIIGLMSGEVDKESFIVKMLVCLCGAMCLTFGILSILIFAAYREGIGDMAEYISGILSIGAGLCMMIDTVYSFTT